MLLEPLNIAIDIRPLIHGHKTGVENYLINILNEIFKIDSKNQYFLYYNSFKNVKSNIPDFSCFSNVQIIYTTIPNKFLNLSLKLFSFPKIDKVIQKKITKKIDIFFMPDPRPISLSKNIPLVTTFHDLSFEHFPENFNHKTKYWHWVLSPKKLAKQTDRIIAVSHFTKADLLKTYPFLSYQKIKVIHEGVPFKIKREINQEKLVQIKKKYNLPESFFLTLSTLEPRKNINSLVKGFLLYKKRYQGAEQLVIAGKKNLNIFNNKELEKGKDVIYLGFIPEEDKSALLTLSKSFLFPSLYEGFGLPALESLSCGTPVLYSKNTAVQEVVQSAGIAINPLSIESISIGLNNITAPFFQSKFPKEAITQSQKFSFKKCAKETLGLLTCP